MLSTAGALLTVPHRECLDAKHLAKENPVMAESEKEYLVGTVRPTNRPEAGQELDLDTLIPA